MATLTLTAISPYKINFTITGIKSGDSVKIFLRKDSSTNMIVQNTYTVSGSTFSMSYNNLEPNTLYAGNFALNGGEASTSTKKTIRTPSGAYVEAIEKGSTTAKIAAHTNTSSYKKVSVSLYTTSTSSNAVKSLSLSTSTEPAIFSFSGLSPGTKYYIQLWVDDYQVYGSGSKPYFTTASSSSGGGDSGGGNSGGGDSGGGDSGGGSGSHSPISIYEIVPDTTYARIEFKPSNSKALYVEFIAKSSSGVTIASQRVEYSGYLQLFTSYVFRNSLTAGTTYKLYVRYEDESEFYTGYTFTTLSPTPTLTLTSQSVSVQATVSGSYTYTKYSIKKIVGNTEYAITLDNGKTDTGFITSKTYLFKNLEPNTTYKVYYGYSNNTTSSVATLYKTTTTPSGSLTINCTDTTATIKVNTSGYNRYKYGIQFYNNSSSLISKGYFTSNTYTFENLSPSTKYTVFVSVGYNESAQWGSLGLDFTTKEKVLEAPTFSCTVQSMSLEVTLTGGDYKQFKYSIKEGTKDIEAATGFTEDRTHVFKNLKPNTTYAIYYGYKNSNQSVSVATVQKNVTTASGSLSVVKKSDTSITVRVSTTGYSWFKYSIQFKGSPSSLSATSYMQNTEYEFTGLNPLTDYTIYVSASRDNAGQWGSLGVDARTLEMTVAPWNWQISNWKATASATQKAYNAIEYKQEMSNFSYLVWNDMVKKINDVLAKKGAGGWWTYGSTSSKPNSTSSVAQCTSSDTTLTATKYNHLIWNIKKHFPSANIVYVNTGDDVIGQTHFINLMNEVNRWLAQG